MPTARRHRVPTDRGRPAGPAPARPAAQPSRRARLSGADRTASILDAAAELFAERGFGGSTREIARRLGVTQALLYRYFNSKEALVAAALGRAFVDRWRPEWDALLADETIPLAERLTRFYVAYGGGTSRTRLRLWMQANLAGAGTAKRFGFRLSLKTLLPVARGLRRAAGIDPDTPAMTLGERELAMVLHGGVAFLNVRRHVYGMDIAEPIDDLVRLQVETWLAGAVPRLRAILAGEAGPRLALPLVTPPGR